MLRLLVSLTLVGPAGAALAHHDHAAPAPIPGGSPLALTYASDRAADLLIATQIEGGRHTQAGESAPYVALSTTLYARLFHVLALEARLPLAWNGLSGATGLSDVAVGVHGLTWLAAGRLWGSLGSLLSLPTGSTESGLGSGRLFLAPTAQLRWMATSDLSAGAMASVGLPLTDPAGGSAGTQDAASPWLTDTQDLTGLLDAAYRAGRFAGRVTLAVRVPVQAAAGGPGLEGSAEGSVLVTPTLRLFAGATIPLAGRRRIDFVATAGLRWAALD